MTLTLQYRPTTFSDVVGQGHVKPILRAFVRSDKVPPALLFVGSRGTGKTTSARILAAALNCAEAKDGDACGSCPSCTSVQRGNSMAVIEIDAASTGNVDDVRTLKELTAYGHEGRWRVVLLDEAHSMSKEAFNALLKILEEPPPSTLFILLTTEPGKILETVQSRCMRFEFRRLTTSDIEGRLKKISDEEKLEVEDSLVSEIATYVEGGMRDAVMVLDQVSRVGVRDVAGFRELFGIKNVAPELFSAAIEGDLQGGQAILEDHFHRVGDASGMVSDLTLLVRDLLIVRSGGTPPVPTKEELDERVRLAARVTTERLTAAIRLLWELKGRTRATDSDHRASMEMAYVLLSESLAAERRAKMPISNGKEQAATMSLDQLREMSKQGG